MSYDLDKELMCKLVAKYSKKDKIQRSDLVEIIVEYESGRSTTPNSDYSEMPSLDSVRKEASKIMSGDGAVDAVYGIIQKLVNFA